MLHPLFHLFFFFIFHSIHQRTWFVTFFHASVHPHFCSFTRTSVTPLQQSFILLPIVLIISPSIHLFHHPSIHLSIHPSVRQIPTYLSILPIIPIWTHLPSPWPGWPLLVFFSLDSSTSDWKAECFWWLIFCLIKGRYINCPINSFMRSSH